MLLKFVFVFSVTSVLLVLAVDLNITRTEELNLTCCISGFPIPSVELCHNNASKFIDSHALPDQRLTNCSVFVKSADYSDSGEYTCKGVSIAGNVTFIPPAFVVVQGMTQLTKF